AYIAVQQWNATKLKLQLDRYDRRANVYKEVSAILRQLVRDDPNGIPLADLSQFVSNTSEAAFFFGPEIPAYLGEIRSHGLKLRQARLEYRDSTQPMPTGYDHGKVVAEGEAQMQWLLEQFENGANQKFAKYLRIHDADSKGFLQKASSI